ncbi:nitroreductase family protein [Sporomusa sp.]|uniref:nitroreductase family protein n=1 Tax=Sporomusa sp. TaxID=2078658 RepID=UPI002CF1402E|nr:nitroreductase family protein [Sporomusa sp.]HWR43559.1 nitroreductase family protein [Sporomusa sp.]
MSDKKPDFKEVAEARRSVNFFDAGKSIEDQTLKEIINLAVLAPSCFNVQPWQIIAVKSKEKREEIYNTACKQPKVLEAPVLLAVIGDKHGYKRDNPIWDEKLRLGHVTPEAVDGSIGYAENVLFATNDQKVAFAASNSALLAMSIMYSAKYYGVDSHPMIGFDEPKLRAIFELPENKIITMLICLGYFDQTKSLYPRETRFTYDKIVKEF